MLLDLIEVLERIENVVLEDGVELVLNACHDSGHLQGVNALIVEAFSPVEGLEVVDLELVENEHHSSDNLRLIHALSGHFEILLGEHVVGGVGLVPDSLSLESVYH